ncbi:uncharacterized protein EURHEDRAFT_411394 [Aspergillus ruber CBS 135680]|uniref:Cytochrome b5 reductase n=1 Tax=Aspergillus ruber (strain CBS 135680) TaxID=1388766 RepID=A0A017SIV1_ASPRC|nr:uncharacterized protein EURHEDRAFT_411394 [Aspergillus ruber CBS 135680]EYE96240.1 hypothetical protein EURHEDRAFT_411394 [Aspergillus ruber CBS 135680]
MPEYTTRDLASHKSRDDLWIAIHGKGTSSSYPYTPKMLKLMITVYNVTPYIRDHPGGADVLLDTAGTDASEAYDEVGHSEDADEILQTYFIGTLKDAQEHRSKNKTVRVIQQPAKSTVEVSKSTESSGSILKTIALVATSGAGVALPVYLFFSSGGNIDIHRFFPKGLPAWPSIASLQQTATAGKGSFTKGFTTATLFMSTLVALAIPKLSALTSPDSGFMKYPPHVKSRRAPKPNPHLAKGFLNPKDYKSLPLVRKDELAPNVYRFVFDLPKSTDVIGLPIGQHVAIKAVINGETVSRSYTPTSNNTDLGRLELVIKCYPDGLLTGKYLAGLQIGDTVQFRGPKGAMKYSRGLCRKIGMIAGGTGITPMYQLIRAICEDEADETEVSLVYANRAEGDILLRKELEAFAKAYPRKLRIWYMLDQPGKGWKYGSGYVTPDVMREKLPAAAPDTRVMLCGPPGMVNAAKKGLVGLGFQASGAVAKMSDQIFCF